MKYITLFQLSDLEKIVALDHHIPCKWNCYGQMPLFLQQNNQYILLSEDSFYDDILSLKEHLELCLQGQLKLSADFAQNLGITYNNCIQNDSDEKPYFETVSDIIGYCCWASEEITTWLYNDQKGSIILQCSPRYNKKPSKKSYDKWLEAYKPLLIQVITHKQAQEWLKETKKILNYIDTMIFKESPKYEI